MQRLILENSLVRFQAAIRSLTNKGYKIVTGSTYVKSVEEASAPILGLTSSGAKPFMSIVLEDDHNKHIMMCHNDPDKFMEEVNKKLDDDNYKMIVGSTYFTDLQEEGFKKGFKHMTTFYTCCLNRE